MFKPLSPIRIGRHFADDPFKYIFLNETVRISIKISLKFVPKGKPITFHIGSDNGLAPTRRQGITWTNGSYITDAYLRHSASMSQGMAIRGLMMPWFIASQKAAVTTQTGESALGYYYVYQDNPFVRDIRIM